MQEHIRKNYFMILKIMLAVSELLYISIYYTNGTKSSITSGQLVLSGLFLLGMTLFETAGIEKKQWAAVAIMTEAFAVCILLWQADEAYCLLLPFVLLDFCTLLQLTNLFWLSLAGGVFFVSGQERMPYAVAAGFLGVIYFQHYVILDRVKKEIQKRELSEVVLKKDMSRQQEDYRQQVDRNRLHFENQILQERAKLSQALHDKLGHSINGSLYQLEAAKVLMEGDPKRSRQMLSLVIDNLRGSMDEIREILRREKPTGQQLALVQLYELCDKCRDEYGIEAELHLNGNSARIPENYWEVLLDNCFEAVSNALKYANCTRIDIEIIVMNQMIRCTVQDNGRGCVDIREGMGLSGMKSRVRKFGGYLDATGECGFRINMLLPYEQKKE